MKTVNPIIKTVSTGKNIQKMPFGHAMSFRVDSYNDENVACIAVKWLPDHSSVDRYKNSNKGLYNSNNWFQVPTSGKFFIYEHDTSPSYYTEFNTEKLSDEQPLWSAEWVGGKINIVAINESN